MVGSAAACSRVPYGETSRTEGKAREANPNPRGVTLVDVNLFVEEITEIDPVGSTFKIERFMDLVWCDPHVAFVSEKTTGQTGFYLNSEKKIFLEENAQEELKRIWWPGVTLLNQEEPRRIENEKLTVSLDGTVHYEEKFAAQLETPYNFRTFPFDWQDLLIEIESFGCNAKHMVLHHDKQYPESHYEDGIDSIQVPEWDMEGVYPKLQTQQKNRDRATFSELVATIKVARHDGSTSGR